MHPDQCFEKATQLVEAFVEPVAEDVEGVCCGHDLLSQYCSSGSSLREGQSLLLMGNCIIRGLARSDVFRGFIESLKIALHICWIGEFPPNDHAFAIEKLQCKSFRLCLNHKSSEYSTSDRSTIEELTRSFDCVWVNTCPSICNSSHYDIAIISII